MLKKEITYESFDGDKITRTFYFHLTRAEWLEMEVQGIGLQRMMEQAMETRDVEAMHNTIKNFVLMGYGVRDGEDFLKTEDLRQRFKATDAYSVLFLELLQDDQKAIDFIRGMLPQEMLKEIDGKLPASVASSPGLAPPTSPIPPPPLPAETIAAGHAIANDAGM